MKSRKRGIIKELRRYIVVIFRFFCLFCCFLYPFIGRADEKWMVARSKKALEQIIKTQEKQKELKIFCLWQLRKNVVPYSCYEWLKKAELKKSKEEKKILIQYLNEKCREFSIHLKEPKKIDEILDNEGLSAFCRKRINLQKKVIEYQLRDHFPPDIFIQRFTETSFY